MPLGLPDLEGVTVGVALTELPVLREPEGDTVGVGVTPAAVGDREGDLEVVPLGVRERLGLWLGEEPELNDEVGEEGGEGVPLALADLEGVTVGVAVTAPPTLGERDGDTVGVGVAPPTEGDLEGVPDFEGDMEGVALGEGVAPPTPGDLEGELEGVVLREPDREGVPLREPELVGDCDAVADGVLLGVDPKELLAVPLWV